MKSLEEGRIFSSHELRQSSNFCPEISPLNQRLVNTQTVGKHLYFWSSLDSEKPNDTQQRGFGFLMFCWKEKM